MHSLSRTTYVIKKGRCHGVRHGKTEEQKEYHLAWNAWERCCKRVDSHGEHGTGIHDRFLRDQVYRESQLAIGWTELAKENHTYHLSTEEFKRYQGQWYLTFNKSGKIGPMRLRPDFGAAVSLKNPSPPRVRWASCRTNFSTTIWEMALFLKRLLVGHVQKFVELMIFFEILPFWLQLISFTVDGDPL